MRNLVAPSLQVMSTPSTSGMPSVTFFHTKAVPFPSMTRFWSDMLTAGALARSSSGFIGAYTYPDTSGISGSVWSVRLLSDMLKLRSLLKLSNFSAEMLLELMLMEEASARYARFSSPSISFLLRSSTSRLSKSLRSYSLSLFSLRFSERTEPLERM